MISRIRGRARSWDPNTQSVEIDVGGVSYEVQLPAYAWRALDPRPDTLEIFIYYHVPDRNPTPVLVGFLRPTERDFFRKFMRVRGIGPTTARRALATSISTIARWIEDEDKPALRRLPGVGARQADQIVAELKGKVLEEALLVDEHYPGLAEPTAPERERALNDAIEALVGLGYGRREAKAWVGEVAGALPTADSETSAAVTEAILRAVFDLLADRT